MKQSVNQIILLWILSIPVTTLNIPVSFSHNKKSHFILRIEILKKKKSSIKIRLIENFNLESDRFDLASPHLFSPSAEMGLGNIFNILIT